MNYLLITNIQKIQVRNLDQLSNSVDEVLENPKLL